VVHVAHEDAEAYAAWSRSALPTEAEGEAVQSAADWTACAVAAR